MSSVAGHLLSIKQSEIWAGLLFLHKKAVPQRFAKLLPHAKPFIEKSCFEEQPSIAKRKAVSKLK